MHILHHHSKKNIAAAFAALIGASAVCAALFALAIPSMAEAADITFSPTSISYPLGEEFSIKITIDAGTSSVNASDGDIEFDPEFLSVANVSKDGSAFSLWTADPTFSNSNGTISYSGGTPNAFSGSKNILTITLKGKKLGTTVVRAVKGQVLAADGKGTDVFAKGGQAEITITEAAAKEEEAPAGGDTFSDEPVGQKPPAPQVNSSTYSKSDSWYATSTGKFDWVLQPDTLGARIGLSADENATPEEVLKGAVGSTTMSGIKDGVSYFLVQLRNDSGWGDVGKKKIQVDTVPPEEFDVALIEGTPAKFSFSAQDELSGVDRYELLINGTVVASPRQEDLTNGTYPVPPQEGGDAQVTVRAYDKASNMREATRTLTLPKVEKPRPEGEVPPQPFWTWEKFVIILLVFLLGMFIAWNQNLRNAILTERAKLLHRVVETGDKNDRVFSAMREEFEHLVNEFDPKPQLTAQERNLLEEIKGVLDQAEEVLDSGFDELKKAIRGQ